MTEETRTYNEERFGYDVVGPCWTCGHQISYFVDEDGTPRDIKPVETTLAAGIAALPLYSVGFTRADAAEAMRDRAVDYVLGAKP